MDIISELKAFIREPYALPGCYPKYLVMTDGEALCKTCARSEYRQISNATRHNLHGGWGAVGVNINWEDNSLFCAHCGGQIESAYGGDA